MASTALQTDEEKKEYFDSPQELDRKVTELAQLVLGARHMTAFTGAGISTSTGIRDFRSGYNTVLATGPGCWETQANQQKYAAAMKEGKPIAAGSAAAAGAPNAPTKTVRSEVRSAYPSATHMAMVDLMERDHLKFIVSQNCDGLHLKSGIPACNIAELHGNTNVEYCEDCGQNYRRDEAVRAANRRKDHRTGRRCERHDCNGYLKDSGIAFGENL